MVGAQAPLLESEKDRTTAQAMFNQLVKDVDATIKSFPKRAWLTLLRLQLLEIADNLDLQFHATEGTIVHDGNLYRKAISSIFSKQTEPRPEILLLKQNEVYLDLPDEIQSIGFLFLNKEELALRFQASGGPIDVSIIHPATTDGHLVKVVVEHRKYSYRSKEHILSISDWGIAYFRLDPSSGLFYLLKVKHGGI
jgi:hypothetical protein